MLHSSPRAVARVAFVAFACAACGLSGCQVGPKAPPSVDPPANDSLLVSKGGGVDLSLAPDERWWTRLGDPTLDELIARAEQGNQSLAVALASVRSAYAGLGVTKGDLWPNFGFGAQYARTLTNVAQLAAAGVNVEPYNMYAYGIGMSAWEIDLWGGVRRRVESAEASARGEIESLRDALVSVRSQVAANYVQLRTLQARRAVLVRNLEALGKSRDLVRGRFAAGTTTSLDVARVEAQYDAVEAQVPSLDAGIASAAASIAVLCGETPSALRALVDEVRPVPGVPEVVGVGLPADLVERRPDVRAARQQLVAATAQIGAAEAARLPTISLSGNFYIASNTVSGLGDLANKAYSFGPSLYLPIFTAGALENSVAQKRAQAEGALAQYRGAVLAAIGDLSASMSDFVLAHESVARADAAATSAREALALAQSQLDAGVIDLTVYLDVERDSLEAENDAVDARATLAQNYVALSRALGSGWSDADAARAATKVADDAGDKSFDGSTKASSEGAKREAAAETPAKSSTNSAAEATTKSAKEATTEPSPEHTATPASSAAAAPQESPQ
jgi:NodT family efflux transporter outer membrane factor (OMF) lipoprotein